MIAFLKKEFDQLFLTSQWLIYLIIFLVIGILNPFTAKITPVLLENMLGNEFGAFIGEVTAVDSWLQFFKNVPQLGLIGVILMMANTMSKELRDGTLSILLAKGLQRKSVIYAKLIFLLLIWTVGYLLMIVVTYGYTQFYWDQSIVLQLPQSLAGLYMIGLLFIVVTFCGNTVMNQTVGGLVFSGGLFLILMIGNVFFASAWNPLTLLANIEQRLLSNQTHSYIEPLISSSILIVACIAISIVHFNKRKL